MTGRRPRRRRAAVEWHGECPGANRGTASTEFTAMPRPAPNRRRGRAARPADRIVDRPRSQSPARTGSARLVRLTSRIAMGIAMFHAALPPSPAPATCRRAFSCPPASRPGRRPTEPAAGAVPRPAAGRGRRCHRAGGRGRAVLQASGLPVAQAVAVGSLPGGPGAGERARSSRGARPRPEDEPGRAGVDGRDIAIFEWVSDGRLVFSVMDLQAGLGEQRGGGLFAVNRDGDRLPRAGADRALAGAQRPDRLPLHRAACRYCATAATTCWCSRTSRNARLSGRLPDGHADRAQDAEERRTSRATSSAGWPTARVRCARRSARTRERRRASGGGRPSRAVGAARRVRPRAARACSGRASMATAR